MTTNNNLNDMQVAAVFISFEFLQLRSKYCRHKTAAVGTFFLPAYLLLIQETL